MPEFIKYPSIEQFRNTVRSVTHTAQYQGQDENGEPVMDRNATMPTVSFRGTVKLHGTNAGVCMDTETGEIWAQSRKNVITPTKDNAGFAFFVETNKDKFREILELYAGDIGVQGKIITIFGEWCGGNIQKGVGICELDKMFVIFGVKLDDNWYPVEPEFCSEDHSIHAIVNFPTYELEIDFREPALSVEKLQELTFAVEEECPVAKQLGASGIGEGIVWQGRYKDQIFTFKVKGEKHSASKVKTLAAVDVEKVNSIHSFVEYAVTENRLNQAVEQVFTIEGAEPEIKRMGDFLRWIMSDIVKEESDTLAASGLEPKDVGRSVSNKAREWFIEYLDKEVMNG